MRQLIFSLIVFSFCFLACKENEKSTAETSTPSEVVSTNSATETTTPTLPQENVTSPAATTPAAPVSPAPVTNTPPPPPPPAPPKEPAKNAKGVWHYTCSKGCKGGAGAVGPCEKCGATLAHNAAYHDGAPTPSSATTNATPTVAPLNQPTQKVEPPQNAKGVWHFICSKGCEGGSGAAGTCGKCSGALTHNAAYHS